jgi:transposase InsO family protein
VSTVEHRQPLESRILHVNPKTGRQGCRFDFRTLRQEVLSAPQSPWQRAYVERLIGSIRRECLDHVIIFSEASLRRMLSLYFSYYHGTRPHLALEKDSPQPRPVQPPELGRVVAVAQVGGLHHRYERRAA